MTDDELTVFLRDGRVCVLVTTGPDGAPDPLPMWYLVDADGRIVMRTYATSQKVKNLERDPQAAVLVESGERYAELRGVQLTGKVSVVSDDAELVVETWTGLMRKYENLNEADAEAFRTIARAKAATQVALVMEPDRVISWDHRKLR